MRLGIIDLGTNSVRFDIYDIPDRPMTAKNFKNLRLYREKIMVKLGQDLFQTGLLSPEAKTRTIAAFIRFSKISKHFKTQKIVAFATSALRETKNPESFLNSIYKKSGIKIDIISGKREAELIARGILKNTKTSKNIYGLIDIGGGSTEISICHGKKILFAESFPIGTARIQQMHLKKIPPTPQSVLQARLGIQSSILNGFENAQPKINLTSVPMMIGSSGTIKALDRLMRSRYSKKQIEIQFLNKLISTLEPMTFKQICNFPNMEQKRIDQIVSGSIILQEFMRALRCKKVKFTEHCLRDGIFDEQLELLNHSRIKNKGGSNKSKEPLYKSIKYNLNKTNPSLMIKIPKKLKASINTKLLEQTVQFFDSAFNMKLKIS